MKIAAIIALVLILLGGGTYFFLEKGSVENIYQASGNGKTNFTSNELGFSLEYPSSKGTLTLKTTGGEAKDSSRYNFTTSDGASMFYVQGSEFSSPTDGMPVARLLNDCSAEKNGCVKKRNANNVEYYYLDNYSYIVGELHLALVPLKDSTLVVSVSRTDSSELPSTPAEEQAYFDLVNSIRLLP